MLKNVTLCDSVARAIDCNQSHL